MNQKLYCPTCADDTVWTSAIKLAEHMADAHALSKDDAAARAYAILHEAPLAPSRAPARKVEKLPRTPIARSAARPSGSVAYAGTVDYAAIVADLKARRDLISAAIAALERLASLDT